MRLKNKDRDTFILKLSEKNEHDREFLLRNVMCLDTYVKSMMEKYSYLYLKFQRIMRCFYVRTIYISLLMCVLATPS